MQNLWYTGQTNNGAPAVLIHPGAWPYLYERYDMTSLPQRPAVTAKACTKCGETKPIADFYYNKNASCSYSRCKRCHNAHVSAYDRANPEKRQASRQAFNQQNPGVRQAQQAKCRAKHPEQRQAYNAAHVEEQRTYFAAYYADHAPQIVARVKAWRADNAERVWQQARERRARNIEQVREQEGVRRAIARETNREAFLRKEARYRQENREAINAQHRAWSAANRDKVQVQVRNRRARLAGAVGAFTKGEWEAVKMAQNFTCLHCARQEPDITLTIDHIVPVAKGGANSIENIQALCGPCNCRKGTR